MDKKNESVDYLDLIARTEEYNSDGWAEGLPAPQEDQAFDYTAVAAAWEKERDRRMGGELPE